MEELNRKLAEWAGIPLDAVDFGLPYQQRVYEPPKFTESLDACFKWLVPKLWELSRPYFLMITLTQLADNGSTPNQFTCSAQRGNECLVMAFHGETPALALCLAIEKLIGD